MLPQVGARLDKVLHALVEEGVVFELLSGGGKGGGHKVAYECLDIGEGIAICEHLACLVNEVLFWRYVVLEGKRENEFPGLDQEWVDGGGEGGGDGGGESSWPVPLGVCPPCRGA